MQKSSLIKKLFLTGIRLCQMSYRRENLCEDRVYLLVTGHRLYQINGCKSTNKQQERAKAAILEFKPQAGVDVGYEIIDGYCQSTEHPVIEGIPCKQKQTFVIKKPQEKQNKHFGSFIFNRNIIRVDTQCPEKEITCVTKQEAEKLQLDSLSIILIDTGHSVHVHIGKQVDCQDKQFALIYALKHVKKQSTQCTPITIIPDSCDCAKQFPKQYPKT
ncbi:hypothetical protein HZS_5834 [Henneguya salminicola]|nr:hypothetical protein HZS_5834 [Henneguya salminicola]